MLDVDHHLYEAHATVDDHHLYADAGCRRPYEAHARVADPSHRANEKVDVRHRLCNEMVCHLRPDRERPEQNPDGVGVCVPHLRAVGHRREKDGYANRQGEAPRTCHH